MFSYRWKLSDGYPAPGVKKNNLKVFGTFISGGGSTMGYKLAGYDHLGGVELDKKMAEIYQANHKPKYLYNEDIIDFNKRTDIPKELYDLGILDGSPPFSSFSMAGNREKDWGKKKKFAEGQKNQVLDTLPFEYIKTIKMLQPKVAILENVQGLIQGNAKIYAKKILVKFKEAGYSVNFYLLDASRMGVPQRRKRVFFVGLRNDLVSKVPSSVLRLNFQQKIIKFGEIFESSNDKMLTKMMKDVWTDRTRADSGFSDIMKRRGRANSFFSWMFCKKEQVCNTLTTHHNNVLYDEPRTLSKKEATLISSFPLDYNFCNKDFLYPMGMSVPPVMMANIAHQINVQWLSKLS